MSEHYVDDVDTAEPGWAKGTGQLYLDEMAGKDLFGFGFDASQTDPMAGSNTYLGVESDISGTDDGFVSMDVSEKRREKLKLVRECVDKNELRSGLASSIFGKARFCFPPATAAWGRPACTPSSSAPARKGAMH